VAEPTYQLLPPLSKDDYDRLAADIERRGVMVPIEVDEEGNILDGHHRKQIADSLRIDCPEKVREGMADHEKRLHAVALNIARRHLTDAQKVLIGREIEPDAREEARRRQELLGRSHGADPSVTNAAKGRAVDDVAKRVGFGSGRTYERAKKVVEEVEAQAPDLLPALKSGDIDLPEAKRQLQKNKKDARVAEIAAATPAPLDSRGPFQVLYADPPWRYDHAETPDLRSIENHYPTMTLEDIQALSVPAADDSVLFLWATSPKLPEAIAVMEAWGFSYRTCMVWRKDRIGMGYYARQQHELLLIGKRGAYPVPDPEDRPPSVIDAPRGEHSAKPHVFYELIERMYPTATYCELFARNRRDRWGSWGNQAVAV
jgi:N6-adenosine-specific RNA methylase IME4/ParB-like chromosome segregation protein Spo0J